MATAKSNEKIQKKARAEKSKAKTNKVAKGAMAKGGASMTAAIESKAAKNSGKKPGNKKVAPKRSPGKLGPGKKTAATRPAGKESAAVKTTAKKTSTVKTAVSKATAGKTTAGKTAAVKTTAGKTTAGKTTAKKPGKAGGKTKDTEFYLEHIESRTLTKIIAKLEEMREESQHIVNTHMQSDLMPREESLDVGDDLDQASNEREREFNLIMHQRHLRRLQQIDDAFNRLDDGSYGLCEGTDEVINPKRLLIMPLTRYSIEYQELQEKTLGRMSMDGGFSEMDESFGTDE